MKNPYVVKLGLMLVSSMTLSSVLAATSTSKSAIASMSAREILSMPEGNREKVADIHKSNSLYGELMGIAFDQKIEFGERWKALTLAAHIKGAEATADLQRACESKEWFMKNAGLISMAKVAPEKAHKVAERFLSDKALVVRAAAVRVMASMPTTEETREILWKELDRSYNYRNKQSLWIRGIIVEALAQKPEKYELALFAKTLRDKDARLHVASIKALERITNKKINNASASIASQRDFWLKQTK